MGTGSRRSVAKEINTMDNPCRGGVAAKLHFLQKEGTLFGVFTENQPFIRVQQVSECLRKILSLCNIQ
jgi:hypothetical protein